MKHLRHLSALLVLAAWAAVAPAQSLRVSMQHLDVVYDATAVGEVPYDATSGAFIINGTAFPVSDVLSISYEEAAADPLAVSVDFDKAHVTVPGAIWPHLQVEAFQQDGICSITADAEVQEEVVYTLSGTDRQFFMDGSFKSTVVLNGVHLQSLDGGAFVCENGKRIRIVVPEGTENTFVDAAGGTQKAAFFVNGHAEFEDAGTVSITGNSRHAYASDEYTILKKSFGALNILGSANDGLHIEQYFEQRGGVVTITNVAGDNVDVSITKDETDEMNGQVLLSGGRLVMDVAEDDTKGLKADSLITITGTVIEAKVGGDGAKGISAGTDLVVRSTETSAPSITMSVTGTTYASGSVDESKCRGIKVKKDFTFDGGSISISATGKKSKAIVVDGVYTYLSGDIDCTVEASVTK